MEHFTTEFQKIKAVLEKNFKISQKKFFGGLTSASDAHFKELLAPTSRLVALGGKRWRPLFCVLCAEMLRESGEISDLECEFACACEFVHTASLIHDDIEDGAVLRRGENAAHIEFGVDVALNSASWLYFHAFSVLRNAPCDEKTRLSAFETLSLQLSRLHLGQAMDIYWHRNAEIIPTREEYAQMVRLKTGTLGVLAAKFGALAAQAEVDDEAFLEKIAADLGFAFQVKDDVLNLTSGNKGKSRGDDIVEGKKSLPVILHCEKHPEDLQAIAGFFEKAKKEGEKSEAIENCIALLNRSHSIENAADIAKTLTKDCCDALQNRFGAKSEKIADLFNWLQN